MTEIVRVPFHGEEPARTIRVEYSPEYVYVLEFSTGVVKVGRSKAPHRRIDQHAIECRRFGADITRSWMSTAHGDSRPTEQALIDWCTERGTPVTGVEYFQGLSFDEVTAFATALPLSPVRPAVDVPGPVGRGLIGPGNVPYRTVQEGMDLAVGLSAYLWQGVLEGLGDRPISAAALRRTVDGIHESVIEGARNPAAWAQPKRGA